jgi:uncharacterized repeat protein (TIGR01451 family)
MINKILISGLSCISLVLGGLAGLSICLNLNVFPNAKNTPQILGVKSNQTALDLNFSTITKGSLAVTGNTLTLSPSKDRLNELSKPEISPDFGDVFISLDKNDQVISYPEFTTRTWQENGSFAMLEIPNNAEILYARLIWGGIYKHNQTSLFDKINSEITFVTPEKTVRVLPEINNTHTQDIISQNRSRSEYIQSVDITDIMKNQKSGIYAVSGVPSLLSTDFSIDDPENFAGWTLVVAYQDNNETIKNLSIFSGLKNIAPENADNGLISLSGFVTPDSQTQNGKIYLSAGEGDGSLNGDQMFFGNDIQNLTKINSIEGSDNNFFASQINTAAGKLDTKGSFGQFNSEINNSDYISRQGYDITSADISSILKPNQTTALIQPTTSEDGYSLNMIALELEVNAASLVINTQVDKDVVVNEDEINYIIEVENVGKNIAQNIKIEDFIPQNAKLEEFNNQGAVIEDQKILVESLNPNQKIQIKYTVSIKDIELENNSSKIITINPKITYSYKLAFNQEFTFDTELSNPVSLILVSNNEADLYQVVLKEKDIITPKLTSTDSIPDQITQNLAKEILVSNFTSNLEQDIFRESIVPEVSYVSELSTPELTLFDQMELLIPDIQMRDSPSMAIFNQKKTELVKQVAQFLGAPIVSLVRSGAGNIHIITTILVLVSISLISYATHLAHSNSNKNDKT